jgi:hypothetical protein
MQRAQQATADSSGGRMQGRYLVVLLFVLFAATAVALTWNSLSYPWFWDDFHLIRPFSLAELAQGLHGNWDPDFQETPGYRPLTLLFDAARATVFGEAVAAQRIFDIALFAAYLSLLGLAAHRLGATSRQVTLAGLIALVTAHSWTDLLWISDGNHALGGLLFILSVLLLLGALEDGQRWKLVGSLVLAGMAPLVKEDSLAIYPLIPALGLAWAVRQYWLATATREATMARVRLIALNGVVLVIMAVGLFVLRKMLVPDAILDANVLRWFRQVYYLFVPMDHALDPVFPLLGLALTLTALALSTRLPTWEARIRAWFWLGCACVSASSGLVVGRTNTLFFPTGFFALFLATVFDEWGMASRSARFVSWALLVVVMGGAAGVNVVAQEAMHPRSTDALQTMGAYVWGPLRSAAVPAARKAFIQSQLRDAEISSHSDMLRVIANAQQHGRDRPNADNAPFVPRIRVLNPFRAFEPCDPSGPVGQLVLARQPCPGDPNLVGDVVGPSEVVPVKPLKCPGQIARRLGRLDGCAVPGIAA